MAKRVGFLPPTMPSSGSTIAPITRQYAARVSPGEYGNLLEPYHLVQEGDRITRAAFAYRASTVGQTSVMNMNAYITNNTGSNEGARVAAWTISTTYSNSSVVALQEAELDIDLSAYVGQYIKPTGGSTSTGRTWFSTVDSGDVVSADHTSNTPFGSTVARTSLPPMWMEITNSLEAVITSVNGGQPVKPGAKSPWVIGGFSPAPTSATLDGVLCEADDMGITPPAYVSGGFVPRPGTSRELIATNETQTASINVPVGVPEGFTYVQLVTIDTGLYNVLVGMDAQPGWFVVYPDAHGNEVDDSGRIRTNALETQTFWLVHGDTGETVSFPVITGDPQVEPAILTVGSSGTITMNLSGGTVTNAITTEGMATLTAVTISTAGAGSYSATGVNAPNGQGVFVAPFWQNGQLAPYPGPVTVTATDGFGSPTISGTFAIPAGYSTRTFASLAATTLQHLQYWLTAIGKPLLAGERAYWATTAEFDIAASSLMTTTTPGDYTVIIHRANHRTEFVNVRVGTGGLVVGIGSGSGSGSVEGIGFITPGFLTFQE